MENNKNIQKLGFVLLSIILSMMFINVINAQTISTSANNIMHITFNLKSIPSSSYNGQITSYLLNGNIIINSNNINNSLKVYGISYNTNTLNPTNTINDYVSLITNNDDNIDLYNINFNIASINSTSYNLTSDISFFGNNYNYASGTIKLHIIKSSPIALIKGYATLKYKILNQSYLNNNIHSINMQLSKNTNTINNTLIKLNKLEFINSNTLIKLNKLDIKLSTKLKDLNQSIITLINKDNNKNNININNNNKKLSNISISQKKDKLSMTSNIILLSNSIYNLNNKILLTNNIQNQSNQTLTGLIKYTNNLNKKITTIYKIIIFSFIVLLLSLLGFIGIKNKENIIKLVNKINKKRENKKDKEKNVELEEVIIIKEGKKIDEKHIDNTTNLLFKLLPDKKKELK